MPWHLPPTKRQALASGLGVVLSVLAAFALTLPAVATAARRPAAKRVTVPRCKHFSVVKMARLINVSSLTFEGQTPGSNVCTYKGPRVPGHYSYLLSVSVVAAPHSVFARLERQALPGIANSGGEYLRLGRSAFGVGHKWPSQGLAPCAAEHTIPEFGPPRCSGDPEWSSTSVYSWGALKRRGPKVIVADGLARQWEGKYGLSLVALNKAILSGQIH